VLQNIQKIFVLGGLQRVVGAGDVRGTQTGADALAHELVHYDSPLCKARYRGRLVRDIALADGFCVPAIGADDRPRGAS
jgi:hypothetical protein